MIKESEMFRKLVSDLQNLSEIEFVDEYNRQTGANITIGAIEWDGCFVQFTKED